jgi:cyclic-di-GMP phosphodiesterase TipF (flagellum assembly factor)
MQVLIKQLAAQLNAAQPPDLAGLADPEQGTADGSRSEAGDPIDQSVAALRETAETMRRADQPKPPVRGSSPTAPPQAGLPAAAAPLPPRSTSATPSPYGRLALIAEAIEAERIDVYLDPILALGERRARHFEVSVRLRTETNEEIDADYYTSIAAETGLLARIDSAKLARTAAVANRLRARGSGGSLFATLAGESLADDGFLNAFADVFAKDDGLGSRLVLTFTQDDVRAFSEAHWDAVSTMAEIGLRFSLEDVSDLDMDFERLKRSGFDFVKLEAQVFLEGLPSGSGNVPASDLCRHLSGLGLALVVGRITEERDLAKIMGFGVLFGQGMLFGAPRPVKVDLRPAQAAA